MKMVENLFFYENLQNSQYLELKKMEKMQIHTTEQIQLNRIPWRLRGLRYIQPMFFVFSDPKY